MRPNTRSSPAAPPLPEGAAVYDDILRELDAWNAREPSADALPFLLSADVQEVLRRLQDGGAQRFNATSARYWSAVDKHLPHTLLRVVDDHRAAPDDLTALAAATREDPLQAVFAPEAGANSPREVALRKIDLMAALWEPFVAWWRSYFSTDAEGNAPVSDLWRLYIPLGEWIVHRKRARRPDGLFMFGFNGSPGAGKTVLTNALTVVVNHLLDTEVEGQAIARSGDDWYLSKSERALLRHHGYDPGQPGLSNRSAPGTHDLDWLMRNLGEMEHSTPRSVIRMGNFDKKSDDQPTGPQRYFEVRGKVGVFLFDLWFAGAETDVDPKRLPDGLQRRVAESLREWGAAFDRMDALWGFNWPSLEQMAREREAQERTTARRHGVPAMSDAHIRSFMAYMIEQPWDWQTTTPIPPEHALTFLGRRDANHRIVAVHRGGRTS